MKSNMKILKALLIVVAVVCIGVAASYPIRYKLELDSTNSTLEDLSDMRRRVMEAQRLDPEDEGGEAPVPADGANAQSAPPAADQAGDAAPEQSAPPRTEAGVTSGDAPADATGAGMPAQSAGAPAQTEGAATERPSDAQAEASATDAAPAAVETPEAESTAAPAGEGPAGPEAEGAAEPARTAAETAETTPTPGIMALIIDDVVIPTRTPPATSTPRPSPSPSPSPTPDRSLRNDADTFKDKVKVRLDVNKILPELKDIYALNHDLVGWLYIEDTNIDYPVVQSDEGKFYLTHDFYGRSNANGQIILEDKCDPYTPSYNLVLSGHHMNSGAMFGRLAKYKDRDYWETHKIVEFDTLMARKRYVVFGAFYSADYDEHEEGFRYSADIQYKLEADQWLNEIWENQIYETGVDAEFGDEFITLTTCDHSRRYDGRFVVVARRIREGENIQ